MKYSMLAIALKGKGKPGRQVEGHRWSVQGLNRDRRDMQHDCGMGDAKKGSRMENKER